jgi:peptidyl-tRNA hydrolase, PTH2 family
MNQGYKMVIVTRKDLKLSPGKLAAQVAHAAVECAFATKKKNKKWYTKWNAEGAKKAVVKTEEVEDFYILKDKAESLHISTALISDAGLTQIPPGTKTVLGIGPAPDNIIDQVTGELSLL